MQIRSTQDFCAGLFFIVVGAAFALASQEYRVGSAGQMGPGYFPTLLALVLILLGGLIAGRSLLADGESLDMSAILPALILCASIVLFGVALAYLGLIAAIFVVVCASTAIVRNPLSVETLALAMLLAAISGGLFVGVLGLPVPLWPSI